MTSAPGTTDSTRTQLKAEGTMLVATFFWGATFVVVKDSIETIPVNWLLTLRFGMAAMIVGIMARFEHKRASSTETFVAQLGTAAPAGILMGTLLYAGYATQTYGLLSTSATKSSFLTGTLALWTPVLAYLAFGRKPMKIMWVAIPVGIVGLSLLIFGRSIGALATDGVVIGDAFTLVCAFCFALHILSTRQATERHSTTQLTAIQLATVTVLGLIVGTAIGEDFSFGYGAGDWLSVFFLAIPATAFAFWAQTRLQSHTSESRTGMILLTEPLFATLLGVLLGDRLGAIQWVGAAILFSAIALPDIIALKRARE